jgi:hypothetical protein
MDVTTLMAKTLGQKGGQKTREKYGNEHFRKLSMLSAKVRKDKAVARRKTAIDI